MPTSGDTTFSVTRDDIIKGALRIVGALAQGELPTADQVTEASEALNLMVKAWESEGMPLWAMKQTAITLTNNVKDYTIGVGQTVNMPKPLKVTQAFLHDNVSNVDIPMVMLTRDEYNFLGNKTSQGQPIQFFYEPLDTYGVLHLFPVPDSWTAANAQITIVYQRPFEDFDSATDIPDFPQEWFDSLKFGLADRLGAEYGVELNDRRDIRAQAMQLKNDALSYGTEQGSFYFQRDIRRW